MSIQVVYMYSVSKKNLRIYRKKMFKKSYSKKGTGLAIFTNYLAEKATGSKKLFCFVIFLKTVLVVNPKF